MGRIKIKQSNGDLRRSNYKVNVILGAVAQALGFTAPPTVSQLLARAHDAGKALRERTVQVDAAKLEREINGMGQ